MSAPATLYRLSALELAERIRVGDTTPSAVMRGAVNRVKETEPALNAFIALCTEQAMAAAESADAELAAGHYRGWLHGIPLGVKDNINLRGLPTTGGSNVMSTTSAVEDAESVRRLVMGGAIPLGKTNLHEFAYGATNINPHWGSVHNPWHHGYIAGGSSGGSAAAVASGQVPLALGTDAAGSIRMPASVCGIVGLKPTYGRVSARGLVASHNSSVDHIGPMTRTVADAAAALTVLAGHDPQDPLSINRPSGRFEDAIRGTESLRGVRIGIPANYFFDLIDPAVEQVVRTAIEQMGQMGAELREVEIPDLEDMMPLRLALFADGLAFHTATLQADPMRYGEDVRTRLLTDHFVLARDQAQAARVRRILQHRFADALRDVDLLAAPTTPIAAVPHEASFVRVRDNRTSEDVGQNTGLLMLRLTAPANLTGLPAISVPCGFTPERLPVGLQLMARPFAEASLLMAAHAYEQTMGWSTMHQPEVW